LALATLHWLWFWRLWQLQGERFVVLLCVCVVMLSVLGVNVMLSLQSRSDHRRCSICVVTSWAGLVANVRSFCFAGATIHDKQFVHPANYWGFM
jgi:hypothetical protein